MILCSDVRCLAPRGATNAGGTSHSDPITRERQALRPAKVPEHPRALNRAHLQRCSFSVHFRQITVGRLHHCMDSSCGVTQRINEIMRSGGLRSTCSPWATGGMDPCRRKTAQVDVRRCGEDATLLRMSRDAKQRPTPRVRYYPSSHRSRFQWTRKGHRP